MKHHDKDELALKKLKADNQDGDGLKEAEVRRQLRTIMRKYRLDYGDDDQPTGNQQDQDSGEGLFKDTKLDKLWKKAQKIGLTEPQLKILKEELRHYEGKLDQYHHLIDQLGHANKKESADIDNHINAFLEAEEEGPTRAEEMDAKLKEKHLELKEDYKRISDSIYKASSGEALKGEFEEEKASQLWRLALKSNFTDDELDGLRDELLHFQNRIKKLKFFEAQLESSRPATAKPTGKDHLEARSEQQKHAEKRVQELDHHVNKLHSEIERKILERHSEL